MLAFFLSLSFYCYLGWRENRRQRMLYGYSFFAALACLTHLSGVFFVFCIAAYETPELWLRRKEELLRWIILHFFIVLPLAVDLLFLYPTLVMYNRFYQAVLQLHLLVPVWFYSFYCIAYLLPPVYLLVLIAFPLLPCLSLRNPKLFPVLALSGIALSLALTLEFAGFYPPQIGLRHHMWILPFIIPAAAGLLADAYDASRGFKRIFPLPLALFIATIGGCMTYNPQARFSDNFEYAIQRDGWQDITHYLAKLPPADIITASTADSQLMENVYAYMDEPKASLVSSARLVPFGQAHFLLNPYYPRYLTTGMLVETLQMARLDPAFSMNGNLIFLETPWTASPFMRMLFCDIPGKKIVAFAKNGSSPPRLALISIPTHVFFDDVIAPKGKAHSCVNE